MRAVMAFGALLVSETVIAATQAAAPAAAAPGSLSGQLAQMVFGLLLVVG